MPACKLLPMTDKDAGDVSFRGALQAPQKGPRGLTQRTDRAGTLHTFLAATLEQSEF